MSRPIHRFLKDIDLERKQLNDLLVSFSTATSSSQDMDERRIDAVSGRIALHSTGRRREPHRFLQLQPRNVDPTAEYTRQPRLNRRSAQQCATKHKHSKSTCGIPNATNLQPMLLEESYSGWQAQRSRSTTTSQPTRLSIPSFLPTMRSQRVLRTSPSEINYARLSRETWTELRG